jgi:formyl-CoA transferase
MSKALEGYKILDMSHVQAGPTCTQIFAWLGADVIKVEMPGRGDITRGQLRDLPNVDSLYFTMLNANKRSITVNMKSEAGKEIVTKLVKQCDVLVENFGPGVLDRQGFSWETLQKINPKIIYASIKGFGPGKFEELKAYETVAQAMGGSMSTTGWENGPPTSTGSQIGDSGTGMHLCAAILAALLQRHKTGRGQRVEVAMQAAVLNLIRVKMRDHQRLFHGPLTEYPNNSFSDFVPRSGNASGGGQPGHACACAPGGANDYIYVIIQPQVWAPLCKAMGRPELIEDAKFATPEARIKRLDEVWSIVETWTRKHDKFKAMAMLNEMEVPCGPIMSTKDLFTDESLRAQKMIVDVKHPTRGSYATVGCPLRLSDSDVDYGAAPLLGEHNEEVLTTMLGYSKDQIKKFKTDGVI